MDEVTFKQLLSEKLVNLRKRSGYSLADIATSAGLSEEQLTKYEKGVALPALGQLMNLALVFGVSMNHFFMADLPESRIEVVRAGERWKVEPQSDTAAALNYSYEALSYRLTNKVMAPFHIQIPPSQDKEAESLSHEGEEFLFILEGTVEIRMEGNTYQLDTGDSIYFDSRLPHAIRALGTRPARLLACLVNVHRPVDSNHPIQRAH